jgi:hypothetical protein
MSLKVLVSDTSYIFDQNCRCYKGVMRVLKKPKHKQKTKQTLVRGFKNRRIEVRVDPAEREFRATSPHEEEEEEIEG